MATVASRSIGNSEPFDRELVVGLADGEPEHRSRRALRGIQWQVDRRAEGVGDVAGESMRVRIERWSEADLDLLRKINTPEMKRHLGGPETEEQVLARHERYVRFSGSAQGCMFRVVALPDEVPVGSVGYWAREWRGSQVYEMGWNVLPAYQGRGLATAALLAVVDAARARRTHRYAHAYPSVENAASNAVCRKAGFELLGETDFEFPKGRLMRSNDWRLDLIGSELS